MTQPVDAVVVAIPAHDEERVLDACLASVALAADEVQRVRPGMPVVVVVAADSCTDRTAAVAGRRSAIVVPIRARAVGAARDAAIVSGLEQLVRPLPQVWIACTDADSVVPSHWLTSQLAQEGLGAELVVGTVEPDGDITPDVLTAWRERHELREDHRHIHGANLGLRASSWQQLDGFGNRQVHEDVELVHRALERGLAVRFTDAHRVQTSARLVNRVPGGFAGYLQELRDDLAG